MLAALLLNPPAPPVVAPPTLKEEESNYPWPGKFKLKKQLAQEDRELLELIAVIMASGVMED